MPSAISTIIAQLVAVLVKPELVERISSAALRHFHSLVSRPSGVYEVLHFEIHLELQDVHGSVAHLTKRLRVRFLEDDIIAFSDQAWGDGEIFADYRCSPGVAVDRYREGHKYRVLISLREAKKRGDVQEFIIERTIKDGFRRRLEDFQLDIDHPTHQVKITVVFPAERPPQTARVIEQNSKQGIALSADAIRRLPDGRWQIQWESQRVKQFEAYLLRWEW